MDRNIGELKKENRKKIDCYEHGSNDGKVDFYPAYIQLEQTNRCNAECIMCNHFYLGNRGAQDINDAVIEKLSIVFPYCETIMLNGDGEPFFSENIVKHISKYKRYGMKIGTNTNLCYIPEDCWELFGKGFDFLNISCDGATKETFEMIRRGLSFDTFLTNLRRLNRIAPNLGKNLDCVIMRENIDEVLMLVEFAKNNGFKSIRLHRMGINPCIGNAYDSDKEFEQYAVIKVLEAKEKATELGIAIQIPNYVSEIERVKKLFFDPVTFSKIIDHRQEIAKEKYKDIRLDIDYFSSQVTDEDFKNGWDASRHCQWAIERCYVDLNGNISTCCFNVRKKMGNILDRSFDDIWNGEAYKQLRMMMAKKQLPYFCKECNWIKEGKF